MSIDQENLLGVFKVWLGQGIIMATLLGVGCFDVRAQTTESTAGNTGLLAKAAPSSAQIPVERFFQRPRVLEAKLSPSGTKVALTTSRGGNRVGLVVIDLGAEGSKAYRVAAFTNADITRFEWVGDKSLVFSVLDLEEGSGEDRRTAPGLYSVNSDGSDLRMLVRRQNVSKITDSSGRDRILEWNHTLLSVPKRQEGVAEDEIVIGRLNISGGELQSVSPMWLNVRTSKTRHIELNAPSGAQGWMFDSKGQARVAKTVTNGRTALFWRGPDETQWRQIAESDLLSPPFIPKAVDDSGNLFGTLKHGTEGFSALTKFDFEKGTPQSPPLVTTPGFDFLGGLILDRAGSKALGVRVDTDVEQTVWFDEGMKLVQVEVDKLLPGQVNRLSCSRCGAPDMVVLVRSYSDQNPGTLFLFEPSKKRLQPVSNVMDDIDPRQMAMVDLHRIKSRDGRDLPVWLTQPSGFKQGQPVPAVVLVHGGPWIRIGHWKWQPMEQFLASRGYLVISPEFRGSAGYGDTHYRAGWKQWGQSMQNDVADALLWAQKQGFATDKACIAGASYGGYSTLMGLIRHPELYRCGVAWVAVTDPTLYVKGSWWISDDISSTARRYMIPQMVGDIEKDADMLNANSPLKQAKDIQAPLLLGFGESDQRVPLAHGERLQAALTDLGRPPEWVTYPNEGHSWRQVSTQVDFAKRVEKFLGQHLK